MSWLSGGSQISQGARLSAPLLGAHWAHPNPFLRYSIVRSADRPRGLGVLVKIVTGRRSSGALTMDAIKFSLLLENRHH